MPVHAGLFEEKFVAMLAFEGQKPNVVAPTPFLSGITAMAERGE